MPYPEPKPQPLPNPDGDLRALPLDPGQVTQAELLVIKEPRLGMVPRARQRVRIISRLRAQQRFKIRSVSTC